MKLISLGPNESNKPDKQDCWIARLDHISLVEEGTINRREYIRLNQISHTIAHRELKELVEKGVFRKKGAGKYIRYELTQG